MLLIYRFRPVTPRSEMAAGVLATGYNLANALLTLTSVAWADRITATSNSNGVVYVNSVVGFGFAACSS
ncbi:MAG: hypothetical protein HW386_1605 [Gammaproteobacteria bacterium]|nr:hypothetical protein [Gammaproteobacteria bacterium]